MRNDYAAKAANCQEQGHVLSPVTLSAEAMEAAGISWSFAKSRNWLEIGGLARQVESAPNATVEWSRPYGQTVTIAFETLHGQIEGQFDPKGIYQSQMSTLHCRVCNLTYLQQLLRDIDPSRCVGFIGNSDKIPAAQVRLWLDLGYPVSADRLPEVWWITSAQELLKGSFAPILINLPESVVGPNQAISNLMQGRFSQRDAPAQEDYIYTRAEVIRTIDDCNQATTAAKRALKQL